MESSYELRALEGGRGSLLCVRAQPRARREGLVGTWNGCVKIAVHEPAEGGRANARLLELLAAALGLAPSSLELASGERSRVKRVRIPLAPGELRSRLARHLEESA